MSTEIVCSNIKQIIVKIVLLQLQQNRIDYYYNIIHSGGNIKRWYSDKHFYGYLLNPHLIVFKNITVTMNGNITDSYIQVQAIYRDEVFYNNFSIQSGDFFIIS